MPRALRLQGITLPVPDLAAAERFYRWVLAMKGSADEPAPGVANLAWGKEDRLRLVEADMPVAREAIELRMESVAPSELAAWLAERGLAPSRVLAPAGDEEELAGLWPAAAIETDPDPAGGNRFVVGLESPADVRLDLHVPLPAAEVVERRRHGPFYRRSKDWSGLENPGLLGVTLGAADASLARLLESVGLARMPGSGPTADGPAPEETPLLAGDHQIRIETRDPSGIYGVASIVAAPRLPDLVRTLERLGAQHRIERNHLLAIDPAGRILAVNGVRSG